MIGVLSIILLVSCKDEKEQSSQEKNTVTTVGDEKSYSDPDQMGEAFISLYNNREYDKIPSFFSTYYWNATNTDSEQLYNKLHTSNSNNPGDYRMSFTDSPDSTHHIYYYTSEKATDSVLVLRSVQENGEWRFTEMFNGHRSETESDHAVVQHEYRQFIQALNSGELERVLPYFPNFDNPNWLVEIMDKYAPFRYVAGDEASFNSTVTIYDKENEEYLLSLEGTETSLIQQPVVYIWNFKGESIFAPFRAEQKRKNSPIAWDPLNNIGVDDLVMQRGKVSSPTEYQKQMKAFLMAFNKKDWESDAVQSFFSGPINNTDNLDLLYEAFAPFDTENIVETSYPVSIQEIVVDKNGMNHTFAILYDSGKLVIWEAPAYDIALGNGIYQEYSENSFLTN
ncbi:hypothetical protein [Paenibacillus sp. USHLN196]|uniref:hypothetical protein n=1 Tax=Paenibacillus sp. USHLN196 TaxID=3081291 RepID=UPI00301ACD48